MVATRLIGDIHGEYNLYLPLIQNCPRSVQVGDFGMGFDYTGEADFVDSMLEGVPGEHQFIRGNHDSPEVCRDCSACISDGDSINGTMFIGGATSIDKAIRTPNVNWWWDEEMSPDEAFEHLEDFLFIKPRVMITHECPESIAHYLCAKENKTKIEDSSLTRTTFERMFYQHQPE